MAQKKKMYLGEESATAGKIIEFIVELTVIAAVGLFVANFFFFSTKNASKAMEPTIRQTSVVFSNRMTYAFTEPKRFDVVAFKRTVASDDKDVLVRRVVALPGETIRIYRGQVFINGEKLDLLGHFSEITSDGIAEEEIRLNAGEYFLLGDMPANSEDSRSSTIGIVRREQIAGKVWITATTITDIHFIK